MGSLLYCIERWVSFIPHSKLIGLNPKRAPYKTGRRTSESRSWDMVCLQHTAAHYNTLQRTAIHCNTLNREEDIGISLVRYVESARHTATHCNALQRTATHCNTLQRTATHSATHRNTLQHTATGKRASEFRSWDTLRAHDTLQHTATHCNASQRTATHCNTSNREKDIGISFVGMFVSARQTVIHCNTLQHTVTRHTGRRTSESRSWDTFRAHDNFLYLCSDHGHSSCINAASFHFIFKVTH